MLSPGEPWATPSAVDQALERGLDLHRGDWRTVFIAITDAVCGQSEAPEWCSATYVGPTRFGERWAITWHGRRFDVIHSPREARVIGVTDPRQGLGGAVAPTRPVTKTGGEAVIAA